MAYFVEDLLINYPLIRDFHQQFGKNNKLACLMDTSLTGLTGDGYYVYLWKYSWHYLPVEESFNNEQTPAETTVSLTDKDDVMERC